MQYVTCNLCGSNEYKVMFEAGVAQLNQIVQCKCCGLMYANPRMKSADCEEIKGYDPTWFPHEQLRQQFEKEALQIKDYDQMRVFINQLYPHRGKLLEIGSSFGYLLNSFKTEGWEPKGIEPLVIACEYAKNEFGIEAIPSTLEEAQLDENSIDVIIMLHVIEHVPDPLSMFKEIFRILKPNGLCIVETPRYDTLVFKLLGKRERSLSCDGHIYFFTTDTLINMTSKAQFEVIKKEYVGRSLTLERLLWNVAVISKSTKFERFIKDVSPRLYFNKVKLHLNVRDMQRLYLRKPS